MLKWIKHFLFYAFALVTLGVCGLFALTHAYEEELVQLVSVEINKKLKAPLTVEGIQLDLFSSFPNAAIKLEEPSLDEGKILQLEHIKLEFSLLDLIRKRIHISSLDLGHGQVFLSQEAGKWNAEVWESTASETSSSVSFDIESIVLRDITLELKDDEGLHLNSRINQLSVSSTTGFTENYVDFNLENFSLQLQSDQWLENVVLQGSTNCRYNKDVFTWWDTQATLGKLELRSAGESHVPDHSFSFTVSNQKNSISDVSIIPFVYKLIPPALDKAAKVKVQAHIVQSKELSVQLKLEVEDGAWALDSLEPISIHSAKGTLSYGGDNNLNIAVDAYNIAWAQLAAKGSNAILRNSKRGFTLKSGNADIALDGLIKNDFICKINYKGHLDLLIDKSSQFILDHAAGDISIAKLESKSQEWTISKGKAKIKERMLYLDKTKFNLQGKDFSYSGSVALPRKLLKEEYGIRGYVEADELDLGALQSFGSGEEKSSITLDINLDYYLKSIRYDAVHLTENVGKLLWKSGGDMQFSNFTSMLNKGSLSGNVLAANLPNGSTSLRGDVILDDIDISSLFKDFKEFGQELFSHKHIDGNLDASLDFDCVLSPDFSLDPSSLQARGNILLAKGQLHNFPLFDDLAAALKTNLLANAFINVKKLSKALEEVSFAELSNRIEIENGNITFPKMAIDSDVFKLNASGKHSLKHEIDYRLDFLLADALNIGENRGNENGKRIFLRITGTTEDPKFSIDKEATRQHKVDKAPIFNLDPLEQEKSSLIVEREDEKPDSSKAQEVESMKEEKKKKRPKWLQQEKEEKTKVEFDFSEEDL